MRRVLIYFGIHHDPDGPSKRSVRYWVELLVIVAMITTALALLRG